MAGIATASTSPQARKHAQKPAPPARCRAPKGYARANHPPASAVRPFNAKSPRGRRWMNRMIATRTTILPRIAPATGSRNLLTMPRASQGPHQIADPAEHNDEKAVDDIDRTEIGADIADLTQRHSGHSGDPRT